MAPVISISPAPAFNVSVKLLAVAEIFPLRVMLAPVPAPLVPTPSALASIVTFEVILTGLSTVIAPEVRIVPANVSELGDEIVSDPRTLKVSSVVLFIDNVPVLLNTKLYELEPDVPITVVPLVPVLNTRLYAVLPVEIPAAVIALLNVMVPS